jgi:hypothetical protein
MTAAVESHCALRSPTPDDDVADVREKAERQLRPGEPAACHGGGPFRAGAHLPKDWRGIGDVSMTLVEQ